MDPEFVQDLQDPDYVEAFIKEWNESRLDMFALSPPNEDLQFSGVMRFYFQDRGQKAVTKCIRVNNEQTVRNIMPILIEKFCPDMKMLATPNYELYEIHGTGDVRKLSLDEKPLLVQLFWHKDDREGRFVLKDGNVKIQPLKFFEINQDEGQLKRRLSRREKKDLKKKRKEEYDLRSKNNDKALVDKVYNELPESSLTRTISNPEAVMRRRRQQKLEKRIKEFQNKEGPQTGGILKIFAESLKPEIPYKTILASVKDNAETVIIAALDKFLITKEHPNNFCIVMAIIPPADSKDSVNLCKERVIRAHDCPLAIQNSWPKSKGILTFHLRRKHGVPEPPPAPKEVATTKRSLSLSMNSKKSKVELPKTPPAQQPSDARRGTSDNISKDLMPYFLELTPEGKEINYKPKIYYIKPHETVIGSSRNPSSDVQYMQLFSPKILPSHCSIVNADGTVSMVPHGPDADVRILGKRIYDTSLLKSGDIVQFGGLHTFRFCNPLDDADDASSIASGGFRESLINSSNNDLPLYNKKDTHSSISPEMMELILNEKGSIVDDDHTLETTFGVSGEVETNKTKKQMYSAKSVDNLQDTSYHSQTSNLRDSYRKYRQSAPDILNSLNNVDNLLPASLSFIDNGKDAFFAAVISEVNGAALSFKLAPTYTLYLAARYVLTQSFHPGINSSEQARLVGNITKQIAISLQQTIQENDCLAGGLAFWMANASELLHFYRQDIDLGPLTQTAQAILAQSIQEAFALLVNAMEEQLSLALPAFLDPSDTVDIHPEELDAILNDEVLERAESTELLNWTSDDNHRTFRINDGPYGGTVGEQWITPALRIKHHGVPIMADILYILSSAMSLLRRCRVNAALTIQLFSQLFHYINMWVFNRIILEPDLRLCTRLWGNCLRVRLSYVEAWAERQGLELAADCHLARIVQTAHLLEARKDTIEDLADLTSTCFKLNSLQIRVLLENYLPEDYEPLLPQDVIDSIVSIAESTSDELTHNDGREVKLEEDIQLQLPFLLPEEGYSSDIVRGVPPGLQEFLEPLCATGLCELILNQQSMGVWTVYQEPYKDSFDESRDSQLLDDLPVQRVTIDKGKSGLGLSICSAKGAHSDFTGIYIKAVIKGSLADKDGRIHAGDQILSVNEIGLVDVTQTQAAQIMGKSGSIITMEIIKGAAFYHGLSAIVEDEVPKNVETVDDNTVNKQSNGNAKLINATNNSAVDKEVQIKGNPNDIKPSQMNSEVKIETKQESALYNEMNSEINEKFNDSDFDEEGNLLTKEEKEKLARQKQREREYEERIAKWEAERLQREAEEEIAMKVQQQRMYYNNTEEMEQEHEMQLENECNEFYMNFEEEGYDNNMARSHYEHQLDVENNLRWITQEQRDKEEQRRLQYEREQMRIKQEILQQEIEKEKLAQEQYIKQNMINKQERERIEQEKLEAERIKKYEEEQEQIRNKREQDYQNELKARKERERIEREKEQQRLEAEKRKQYEEEQEKIRLKQEQEYQNKLRAQKERERIEKEKEQQRLEAERRKQYEEEQEKVRLRREEEYQNELRAQKERERIEKEREQQRLEAEQRKQLEEQEYQLRAQKERIRLEKEREQQRLEIEIRKKYEEEQEKVRVKREQEYQNELRAQKERERIEQEKEQQRLEAERIKKYEEEQEQIRIKREKDYQDELRARKERERIEREKEQQRLEAEKRRQYEEEQEKIRFKQEQEYQNKLKAQKERERIEKEKEQQRLEAERRKQYEEEQEKVRVRRELEYQNELRAQKVREIIEKEKKQEEEKKRKLEEERNVGSYQNLVEKMRKVKLEETPNKRTQESNELDREMANIDDALREAERIAAEMDFLMFEEEQKIEEDSIKKKKEEKFDWGKSDFKSRDERNQHKVVSAKSSIDFLPPPPGDLLFVSTPQQNRYEPSRSTIENDTSLKSLNNNIFEKMVDKQQSVKEHEEEKSPLIKRVNDQFNENRFEKKSPAVKPKNYKQIIQTSNIDSQKNNINNRSGLAPKSPSVSSKSQDGASSDEDLAPPRPPPPRNGASPISPLLQTIHKGSNQKNGHQNVSLDKSFNMQPVTILIKDGEPEVLNMKSKLKLFNDFQS
ncbi:afadin isoform X2 [Hydra vulgaris]|uniref:Afadin isoform X2 n=1 Tax=Hydra vulgaris TaxID=6087 RepID=A0ABM4BM58_HYDVU